MAPDSQVLASTRPVKAASCSYKDHTTCHPNKRDNRRTTPESTDLDGAPPRPTDTSPPAWAARPLNSLPDSTASYEAHGTPDFHRIRKVCEKGLDANIDLRPIAFAKYKTDNWPTPVSDLLPHNLMKVYDVVRKQGVPNALGPRIPVPSNLNVQQWEHNLDSIVGRPQLLDFIK